jgi:hypothetical protein
MVDWAGKNMLHVILMILKIIGIILLVILGILLAVLLIILFVPLRYRIHVKAGNGIIEAKGQVSWLLRLLRVNMTFADMKGHVEIMILKFRLKAFDFPKKDAPGKNVQHTDDAAIPETPPHEGGAAVQETASHADDNVVPEDASHADGAAVQVNEPRTDEKDVPEEDSPEESSGNGSTEESPEDGSTAGPESGGRTAGKQPGLTGKIIDLIRSLLQMVWEILLQLPGLPAQMHDRIDCVMQKICSKFDQICSKIAPFLTVAGEHMIEKCIRYLRYLLRGYAPRRIEGYLRFGTDSPDMTGKLTGLAFVLIPAAGDTYQLEPDFHKSVLETDTTIYGVIRMYRVAWVGFKLFIDKEFWTLLRMVRGKDTKAKGKKKSGHKRH